VTGIVLLGTMVAVCSAGAVQPLMALKDTVCSPTSNPCSVLPLFCHWPLSTRHCAPAFIAAGGVIDTVKDPDWRGVTWQPHNSVTAVMRQKIEKIKHSLFMGLPLLCVNELDIVCPA
jgi:hypothetical protein